ncbi:hypothetical protein IAT40_005312 [Kwoniella sp. CBS 6097]
MVAQEPSTPRVAPIKLKLNLGGKLGASSSNNTPSTPTPAFSSHNTTETPTAASRKGKGRAKALQVDAAQDDPVSTPVKASGKKKATKSTKISLSIPALSASNNREHSESENNAQEDEQPEAGPSRPRSATPQQPIEVDEAEEVVVDGAEDDPAVTSPASRAAQSPVTPAPALKATPKSRGRPSSSKRTAKFTPKGRLNKAKARARPSAIPSHLQSEISTPATPSALSQSVLLPETPDGQRSIKLESSENTSPDPLSLPMSPSAAGYGTGEIPSTPQGDGGDDVATPATGRGRRGGRWMRVKRPLKELLNRIMTEIRKKDDYALFEEPVDLEAFPDYLGVIGGEANMMDMGTMQSKVDNGEYTSIEQIEADLKTLVTSAQKFNPPGTIPYNSASRILTIGMKHVERSRPLVLTPSPSPTRNSATPFRGGSVVSGRDKEDTVAPGYEEPATAIEDLPPSSVIPEKMLDFPPNSLQALAVGWNMNGGRRIHAKRIVRSREKFSGKWRHWDLDGTRDVAEMEDIESLLDQWRSKNGDDMRNVVNLKAVRRSGAWWESDASLASTSTMAGNPPLPYAAYAPRRDKIIERELGPNEWGLNAAIEHEVSFLRKRTGMKEADGSEILAEHIRPMIPRHPKRELPPPPNLINIYDTNPKKPNRPVGDWIREMCTGDTTGEAYLTSVDTFVQGAMASASTSSSTSASLSVSSRPDSLDLKGNVEKGEAVDEAMPLDEYVFRNYQNGILSSGARHVAWTTFNALTSALPAERQSYTSSSSTATEVASRPSWAIESARQAYARYAMKQLTSPANPMDIKPLLRMENDFLHVGVGGKSGVTEGLDWIGREIGRMDKDLREKQKGDELDLESVQDKAGPTTGIQDTAGRGGADGKRKREDDAMDVDGDKSDNKKIKIEEPALQSAGLSSGNTEQPESSAKPAVALPLVTKPNGIALLPTTTESGTALEDTPELRRLRLELVALSKFYPLPALKKMTREEADKLLPLNVRGLMVSGMVPLRGSAYPESKTKEKYKDKERDRGKDGEGKKRK